VSSFLVHRDRARGASLVNRDMASDGCAASSRGSILRLHYVRRVLADLRLARVGHVAFDEERRRMNSEDKLIIIAGEIRDAMPQRARDLERASRELTAAYMQIAQLREELKFFCGRVDKETRRRLDAQARAGRLARDARR
jgi:hypothetical protein